MNLIQKIYLKFLGYFRKKRKPHENKIQIRQYIASLNFKLVDYKNLDIICELPDISQLSPDDIINLAENYADLLVRINNGYLKNDIINILKNHPSKQDTESQLLADNILIFCDILQNEYDKQAFDVTNKPVVKPSAVFKT